MTTRYPTYSPDERTIVVGILAEALVVAIPQTPAYELASVLTALNESETWGDFRRDCPPGYWEEVEDLYDEDWSHVPWPPPDTLAFDPRGQLWGFDEADWPPWVAQEMLEWLPDSVLDSFSETGVSMVSGSCALIQPDRLDDFMAAMTSLGYECIRDDNLIHYVSLHDPPDPEWQFAGSTGSSP